MTGLAVVVLMSTDNGPEYHRKITADELERHEVVWEESVEV